MFQLFNRLLGQLRLLVSCDPLDRCRQVRLPSRLVNRSEKAKDQLARSGEAEACRWLENNGMRVLQRNIRFPEGELDIVAREGSVLVFVEVKTRQAATFGTPDAAIDRAKQRRLIAAANRFISLFRLQKVPARFDVIAVLWPPGGEAQVQHFRNAYQANDFY